jgi:hypothetical protein
MVESGFGQTTPQHYRTGCVQCTRVLTFAYECARCLSSQVVFVFFLTTLAAAIFDSIKQIVENPLSIFTLLGDSVSGTPPHPHTHTRSHTHTHTHTHTSARTHSTPPTLARATPMNIATISYFHSQASKHLRHSALLL